MTLQGWPLEASKNIYGVQEVDGSEIEYLNHTTYYELPLSGYALFKGEVCYYSVLQDEEWWRGLYRLSEEGKKLALDYMKWSVKNCPDTIYDKGVEVLKSRGEAFLVLPREVEETPCSREMQPWLKEKRHPGELFSVFRCGLNPSEETLKWAQWVVDSSWANLFEWVYGTRDAGIEFYREGFLTLEICGDGEYSYIYKDLSKEPSDPERIQVGEGPLTEEALERTLIDLSQIPTK